MKGIKLSTFVIFGLASLAGAALLHTSQSVQQAEEKLATIQAEIEKEEEKIRVLNAEWEYLNRPDRLEKLANEFLDLVPPTPMQMPENFMPEAATLPNRQTEKQSGVLPVSSLHGSSVQSSKVVMDYTHKACNDDSNGCENFVPRPPAKPSALKSQKPTKKFDALIDELGQGEASAP